MSRKTHGFRVSENALTIPYWQKMSMLAAPPLTPAFWDVGGRVTVSVMNESAEKQQGLRRLFPELQDGELENLARYFDLALEVAGQDSIRAQETFDITPPISTLKERSHSNLKNQS